MNRKALSEILAYVILITMALALSVVVYSWLKCYIPGSCGETARECPEGVNVVIKEYSCSDGNLNITLENKGVFSADGVVMRVNDLRDPLAETRIGVYTLGSSTGKFLNKFSPGASFNYTFNIFNDIYDGGSHPPVTTITFLEVQPFVNASIGSKDIIFCKKISSQKISC
jgi:hypothetical protein